MQAAITKLAERELDLASAQALYMRAAKQPFDIRMPPVAHTRDLVVPFDFDLTTVFTTVTSPAIAQFILFVYNPTGKGSVNMYTSAAPATAWGAPVSNIDSANLGIVNTQISECRVGLGGMKVSYDCIAGTSLPAKLYAGRLPTSADSLATFTPNGMLTLGAFHEARSNVAQVTWVPTDNQNLLFSANPLTSGATSLDSRSCILVYAADISSLAARVNLSAIGQAEGLPLSLQVGLFGGLDNNSALNNSHSNYNIGDTMDTVTGFIWAATEAISGFPIGKLTAAGTFAARALKSWYGSSKPVRMAVHHDPSSTMMVELESQWSTFTDVELTSILSKPKSARSFLDLVKSQDVARSLFLRFGPPDAVASSTVGTLSPPSTSSTSEPTTAPISLVRPVSRWF